MDLLGHYPFRYVDRTRVWTVPEVYSEPEQEVQLVVRLQDLRELRGGRGKRLVGTAQCGPHEIELMWFKGIQDKQEDAFGSILCDLRETSTKGQADLCPSRNGRDPGRAELFREGLTSLLEHRKLWERSVEQRNRQISVN